MNDKIETPTCLLIDPDASPLDLEDALAERLHKARGVLACLLAEDQFKVLSEGNLANTLWCIQGLVEEADALQEVLWERLREEAQP